MRRFFLLLSFVLWSGPVDAAPDEQVLVVPFYLAEDPGSNNYYYTRLLRLILDKTLDDYGPYRLELPAGHMIDDRLKASVMQGLVDIAWFSSSKEAERQMRAIEIPLLGEINQYRLLLIRGDDQARFSAVQNLDDLRQFSGGIGAQWVDADVMKANRLPYVSSTGFGRLFRMLSAGRFDYFSRGLYQIYDEINLYPELNLEIERTLMLAYPSRVYFFVRKDNIELATRIEKGLRQTQIDGSYDELFNSIPRFRRALEELNQHQRRVLTLVPAGAEEAP